jgi:predicted secreted protein
MAAIAGTAGSVTFAGHIGRAMQWTVNSVQDVNDASGFGLSGNWRVNLAGMKGWRASVSGYLLRDEAGVAPSADFSATSDDTGITFTGTVSSTATACTLIGVGIPTAISVGTGINGNATFSIDIVGTAALTEAWDETP